MTSQAALIFVGWLSTAGLLPEQQTLVEDPQLHVETRSPDNRQLRERLRQQEQELEVLRARLAELEGWEDYQEAELMGVVEAVEPSGLPAHVQRRVALAVVREARKHNVDPLLVVAVIQTESSFDNFATSRVGALGLMQVMPRTGHYLAEQQGTPLQRTTNLFDPELNVELGVAYLADLIIRFGSVERGLVAYNHGPGAAATLLADATLSQRALAGYPAKVLRAFRKLQDQHRPPPQAALKEPAQAILGGRA